MVVGKRKGNLTYPGAPRIPVFTLLAGYLASVGSPVNEEVEPCNV